MVDQGLHTATHQNESEEKFRALFNSMAEGFALHEIITDDQGEPVDYLFVEVNPAFEQLTGTCSAEVVGKTVLEKFPGIEKIWIERYGRVALTGQSEKFSDYSKGTGRWYEVSAYCPKKGQFACVFTDVTDRKRLEEKLQQSQRMETVGTLAGGIAHEFNNILTTIMGAGSMLQMKLDSDPELGPFVRQVLTSSERAARLTHDLLIFSRKQIGRPVMIDLNDTVMEMKGFIRSVAGARITLELSISADPLPVLADRERLEQTLINLAHNACEAMQHGGILRIETALVHISAHTPIVEGCQPGRYAHITVCDSGIGMDSETQSRIFEPFFTTKGHRNASGLGLSIAFGIVKQHDGAIIVSSQPGKGSTFKIFLPLHKDSNMPVLPIDQ